MSVQVVALGNVYEVGLSFPTPVEQQSELFRSDEMHLSQKAAYWETPYGQPAIVVARSPVRRWHSSLGRPDWVCPPQVTSSICSDLLADHTTIDSLRRALDPARPVHLAPYAHTGHVVRVAEWMAAQGFRVQDWPAAQAELTTLFLSKSRVHREVFGSSPELLALRPQCQIVNEVEELPSGIRRLAEATGCAEAVVKSDLGVGGDGVFFIDATAAREAAGVGAILDLLVARGYNVPRVEPPFVLEQRIASIASPTVDLWIYSPTDVELVGLCAQRLYDRRYYAGFYMQSWSVLRRSNWVSSTIDASKLIGHRLAGFGYRGPLKIDFVIAANDQPYVVEINPRRSALVDGISLVRRLERTENKLFEASVADYIEVPSHLSREDVERVLLQVGAKLGVRIVVTLDGGFDTGYRWVALAAIGDRDCELALREAVAALGSLGQWTIEEVVGAVEGWSLSNH